MHLEHDKPKRGEEIQDENGYLEPQILMQREQSLPGANFAQRLLAALERAGVPAKPAVVEREFNQRFWGKPITLHGARLWLRGETFPSHDKVLCLAE